MGRTLGSWAKTTVGSSALVLVAGSAGYAGWTRHAAPAAAPKTLAVLPFDNLSGDPAQEYFSAGFTEDLTTELARINPDTLSVIART